MVYRVHRTPQNSMCRSDGVRPVLPEVYLVAPRRTGGGWQRGEAGKGISLGRSEDSPDHGAMGVEAHRCFGGRKN